MTNENPAPDAGPSEQDIADMFGMTDKHDPYGNEEFANEFFDDVRTSDVGGPGQPDTASVQVDHSQDPPPSPELKKWGDPDQGEKTFDTEVEYLNWKKGNDGMKWGQEKAELRAEIAELRGRLEERDRFQQVQQQAPQNDTPALSQVMTQLFSEERLESEEWKPILREVGQAIMKYDQLVARQMQAQQESFKQQLEKMQGNMTEVSARSRFGIDETEEQRILEQKSGPVRKVLERMPLEDRLAVLADERGSVADVAHDDRPPTRVIPRPTESEYVEGSAPRLTERSDKDYAKGFDKLSAADQLRVIQGKMGDDDDFTSNFQAPESGFL
jgi:hypothetical protein